MRQLPLKPYGCNKTEANNLPKIFIVRRRFASQIKLTNQIYPKVENGALLRVESFEDARLSVYRDRVDNHFFSQFKNLLLITLILSIYHSCIVFFLF